MTEKRKKNFYEKYVKRSLDVTGSLLIIILFGWLFILIAIFVKIKLGSPVVFKQFRPGLIDDKTGQEKIFVIYKFRTMSDKRDETGKLLPDEERLGSFGRFLRRSSLDELLEVINILKGDMSIIGPRPQLVRDMVFMSIEQRMRHTAKPGLSGLAQVKGRNAISWEEKIEWDLKYIEKICFMEDAKILILTVQKVFGKKETKAELDVADDYGDVLLEAGKISQIEYAQKMELAKRLIEEVKK